MSTLAAACCFFFLNEPAPTEFSPLPLPAALPIGVVVRAGAYIAHDDGHYAASPPLPFRAALTVRGRVLSRPEPGRALLDFGKRDAPVDLGPPIDRKSTRLNSSHLVISYAVFCLKK